MLITFTNTKDELICKPTNESALTFIFIFILSKIKILNRDV